MRLAILVLFSWSAFASDLMAPPEELYRGWLKMYDLNFDSAHRDFAEWMGRKPASPLGPASDAAAYLFSELARLGALEAELFTEDSRFENRSKLQPDPQVRGSFERKITDADHLADAALETRAADPDALFSKSLVNGLRADYAALIDKHDLEALKYTKESRTYADRLMAIEPKAYDAYLGAGVENYLLSLKPAPVRVL